MPPAASADAIDREISTPNRPESFHLFPNFPKEIRLQIWRQYLDIPRVIGVKTPHDFYYTLCHSANKIYGDLSQLHHVNREARSEALRLRQMYNANRDTTYQWYADLNADVLWWMGENEDFEKLLMGFPRLRFQTRSARGAVLRSPPRKVAVSGNWWLSNLYLSHGELVPDTWKMTMAMDLLSSAAVTELLLVFDHTFKDPNHGREIFLREPSLAVLKPRLEAVYDSAHMQFSTWEEWALALRQHVFNVQEVKKEEIEKLAASSMLSVPPRKNTELISCGWCKARDPYCPGFEKYRER